MSASDLLHHLRLALSTRTNLLVRLVTFREQGDELRHQSALGQWICSACSAPSERRTAHIPAAAPSSDGKDGSPASQAGMGRTAVLRSFFSDWATRELPHVLVLPRLDGYLPSVQVAIHEVLRDRRFILEGESHNLPEGFVLVGITSDFGSAAKHLIDSFGLSATVSRVPPSSSRELLSPLVPASPPLYTAPALKTYISDLLSATRHHPLLQSNLITYRCSQKHIITIASAHVRLQAQREAGAQSAVEEIRPQDIRDVYAACVRHRLRTRRPDERLARFLGSQAGSHGSVLLDPDGGMATVEEILDGILDEI